MATIIKPPNLEGFTGKQPVRNDRDTFGDLVDAFVTWFLSLFTPLSQAISATHNNAQVAYDSANTASQSAVIAGQAANAVAFVSGQNYAQFSGAISRVNFLTYRKKTPTSSGATDPANDPTNWAVLSGAVFDDDTLLAQAYSVSIALTL